MLQELRKEVTIVLVEHDMERCAALGRPASRDGLQAAFIASGVPRCLAVDPLGNTKK